MNWRTYIHTDLTVLAEKPVIKGARLSVELLLERLANGWTEQMNVDSYPMLPEGAIQAVYATVIENGIIRQRPIPSTSPA